MKSQRNGQSRKLIYLLDKEMIYLWRNDKSKKIRTGTVNCVQVTSRYMEAALVDDKGYFNKFACTDPFQHWFPVSSNKNILLFLVQRRHYSHGKFGGLFWGKKEEVSTFLGGMSWTPSLGWGSESSIILGRENSTLEDKTWMRLTFLINMKKRW